MRKIEINFELAVELDEKAERALHKLVDYICDMNRPEGMEFWPAGQGSKPIFSQADSAFLGMLVDPDSPTSGEPTFDDEIYYIECAARESYPSEIESRKQKAIKVEERAARWDSRLAGWLHRKGYTRTSWALADLSFWWRRKTRRQS